MALRGTLIYLSALAVLSSTTAQDETTPVDCSSNTIFERLEADLKEAATCREAQSSQLSTDQRAALLLSLRNLSDALHKHQLTACHGEPKECPRAEVPSNGGLACVTVGDNRYCKPMCNHGYDFTFLRRSRLFEECSNQTNHKWTTQHIGGNNLGVCSESAIQISGANSAYFPKDQDCLTTQSNSTLQNIVYDQFIADLKAEGKDGEAKQFCLVCG